MAWNILIVDDSATMRGMIKRIVQMSGVPAGLIVEAANGILALQQLDVHKIDLVLADLNMPEMSGTELTGHILSDEKLRHIPVVIVSAEPSAARIAELRSEGVRGFLRKPFTPEALREVLTDVLGAVHA